MGDQPVDLQFLVPDYGQEAAILAEGTVLEIGNSIEFEAGAILLGVQDIADMQNSFAADRQLLYLGHPRQIRDIVVESHLPEPLRAGAGDSDETLGPPGCPRQL